MVLTQSYADSLADPFTHQGPKLGWGCLVPSTMTTCYLRAAATANADGTLVLIAVPNAKNMARAGTGGAAVALNGAADAIDQAAVTASFGSGRVVSLGIRAFPSIAATAAPGASYSGALEGTNTTLLTAMTPADFVAFPQSHVGIASNGAVATGRPQDTDSFRFANEVVDGTGWAGADELPFSCPYIAFQGLPASAVVYYEIVMNVEGLVLTKHSSAGLAQGTTFGDTLSQTWASFEQMYHAIAPYLPPVAKNSLTNFSVSNTLGAFAGRMLSNSLTRRLNPDGSDRRRGLGVRLLRAA